MKIDYGTHYTNEYFEGEKTYTDAQGIIRNYSGPALRWEGFEFIADALAPLVSGKRALDIGCSAGDLCQYLQQKGFDAWGVDISEYAIKNTVEGMRGKTALLDITTTPDKIEGFPDTFDLVLSTDLLEHIYEEDLDRTFDWIVSKSNKWLFFCVATAAHDKEQFILKKGEEVPKHMEGVAVSGHVNVRPFTYWARYFRSKSLKIRWDLMYMFQMKREMNPAWRATIGWNMTTTFFLEKTNA